MPSWPAGGGSCAKPEATAQPYGLRHSVRIASIAAHERVFASHVPAAAGGRQCQYLIKLKTS
jgi:hypothetical protein